MTSERIGHWIKMRRSLAQFSGPEASNPTPYLADFITITCALGFRYTQRRGFLSLRIEENLRLSLFQALAAMLTGGSAHSDC
jgi:hypothetical protein